MGTSGLGVCQIDRLLPSNTPKPNLAGCSRNALRPEERVMWHRCYSGHLIPILIVLKPNMATCSDWLSHKNLTCQVILHLHHGYPWERMSCDYFSHSSRLSWCNYITKRSGPRTPWKIPRQASLYASTRHPYSLSLAPHVCNLGKALQKSGPSPCCFIFSPRETLKVEVPLFESPPYHFPTSRSSLSFVLLCSGFPWFIFLRPVFPARRMPR